MEVTIESLACEQLALQIQERLCANRVRAFALYQHAEECYRRVGRGFIAFHFASFAEAKAFLERFDKETRLEISVTYMTQRDAELIQSDKLIKYVKTYQIATNFVLNVSIKYSALSNGDETSVSAIMVQFV